CCGLRRDARQRNWRQRSVCAQKRRRNLQSLEGEKALVSRRWKADAPARSARALIGKTPPGDPTETPVRRPPAQWSVALTGGNSEDRIPRRHAASSRTMAGG